ncbi:uncharacterized protein [Onthophagus taurus]|nr:RNA-binding protein 4.1 isoform X2 [Onthophagus taurus]
MSRRSSTTTKVFVGNLPANATTKDLRELFAPYGAIAECDIAIRCGFLHLEDSDMAMKAIEELNNSTFMGVRISVEKGRVKPFGRRNRGGGGSGPLHGGGRERSGPYSRDNLGRPPRIGGGGYGGGYGGDGDYGVYGDDYGFNRNGGRYNDDYGGDSRGYAYDDRRTGDVYGRNYPNGYGYDDRSYVDIPQSGYDDRRMGMAPLAPTGDYDDMSQRYGSMGTMDNRRGIMDQPGAQPKPMASGYDHSQPDSYGRRDAMNKLIDRQSMGYSTNPNVNYGGVAATSVYGQTSSNWSGGGVSSMDYSDGRGSTSTMGVANTSYVDSRNAPVDPGVYGDNNSLYADGRSIGNHPVTPLINSYNTASPITYGTPANYVNVTGSGYESGYGMPRNGGGGGGMGGGGGSYEASYPPLPPQRG